MGSRRVLNNEGCPLQQSQVRMVAKADENPHSRSNVSEIGLSADGQESCNEGGGNEHGDLFVILRNDRSWREGESWR